MGMTTLLINDLKAYVPAKDFETSKQFYLALGFAMSDGWAGTVDFRIGEHAFRLQNYYVKEWAENFMFVMGVDNVEDWFTKASQVIATGNFAGAHVQPIEDVGDSRVLHVGDPSGVLLIFVG